MVPRNPTKDMNNVILIFLYEYLIHYQSEDSNVQ